MSISATLFFSISEFVILELDRLYALGGALLILPL